MLKVVNGKSSVAVSTVKNDKGINYNRLNKAITVLKLVPEVLLLAIGGIDLNKYDGIVQVRE